ncbi:MAG: hypothetical protein PHQ27_06320 [Victivallales bacterium]|nr:hypothetical protein [Victivallales bacterium]
MQQQGVKCNGDAALFTAAFETADAAATTWSDLAWFASRRSGRLYLLSSRCRGLTTAAASGLTAAILLAALVQQIMLTLAISLPVGVVAGMATFFLLEYRRRRRQRNLPHLPLAVIDPEQDKLRFFRRGGVAGILIPTSRLELRLSSVEEVALIRGHRGCRLKRRPGGRISGSCILSLVVRESGAPGRRIVIWGGGDLDYRLVEPLARAADLPLRERIVFMD